MRRAMRPASANRAAQATVCSANHDSVSVSDYDAFEDQTASYVEVASLAPMVPRAYECPLTTRVPGTKTGGW